MSKTDLHRRAHDYAQRRSLVVDERLGYGMHGIVLLDQSPDFSEEVLADWRAKKLEQFEKRWPDVEVILRSHAELFNLGNKPTRSNHNVLLQLT